ncbi:hypothetical protein HCR_20900 [Hydrogenimonas cancrithermarum]|uniref:1-aminocyclopropane-1-carboxylate deaminase n=2 Tax=Hydrogenimonas cancrithermarum TaxID=2993563 RepID=A0ABM8FMZ7_9BACT|nr:hypothetical protein HCR_20900 [Hydrogenimonas cancrithermarum]
MSYGGSQSNAMLSLAYLAKSKGWDFVYYVKKLPDWLAKNPTGNLKLALDLGMKAVEIPHSEFYGRIEDVRSTLSDDTLLVAQGGAEKIAEEGVRLLAKEILSWANRKGIGSCSVATPSGTGTTALYLRRHLPKEIEVLTTPVVGDRDTLLAQWHELEPDEPFLPKILEHWPKHPFAKPKKCYFDAWHSLKRSGVEFDLVYAPKMWLELLSAYENLQKPILYIHSGGVSGNMSQIEHYRYSGIL